MDFNNRSKRGNRGKIDEPITTIVKQKESKQASPTCYRFNAYDKAEIALAVSNVKEYSVTKVTPAKLIRALVRLNNLGYIEQEELAKMIDSL